VRSVAGQRIVGRRAASRHREPGPACSLRPCRVRFVRTVCLQARMKRSVTVRGRIIELGRLRGLLATAAAACGCLAGGESACERAVRTVVGGSMGCTDWAIVRVSSRNFVRIGELAGVLGYLHGSSHIGGSDQRNACLLLLDRGQDKVDAR
jgi:hypothetical protein